LEAGSGVRFDSRSTGGKSRMSKQLMRRSTAVPAVARLARATNVLPNLTATTLPPFLALLHRRSTPTEPLHCLRLGVGVIAQGGKVVPGDEVTDYAPWAIHDHHDSPVVAHVTRATSEPFRFVLTLDPASSRSWLLK
jgi:hypothetical protein